MKCLFTSARRSIFRPACRQIRTQRQRWIDTLWRLHLKWIQSKLIGIKSSWSQGGEESGVAMTTFIKALMSCHGNAAFLHNLFNWQHWLNYSNSFQFPVMLIFPYLNQLKMIELFNCLVWWGAMRCGIRNRVSWVRSWLKMTEKWLKNDSGKWNMGRNK